MKAYQTYSPRDYTHQGCRPTPKRARSRAAKRSCRQQGKAQCQGGEG